MIAGWSSLVARRAHNPEVIGSNPVPATDDKTQFLDESWVFLLSKLYLNSFYERDSSNWSTDKKE